MIYSFLFDKILICIKKVWRKMVSPSIILWVLSIVLTVGVAIVSCVWQLKSEQILSASVAAAAIPLAFMTQQAILKEDKKQQIRLKAYDGLRKTLRELSSALSTLAVSSLDDWNKVIPRQIDILQATANFTNHYHTYEMAFKPIENEFRYIHFSSQKLTNMLSTISVNIERQRGTLYGYNADDAIDLLKYNECKELADDILLYLYDLEKDSMKLLHFDSLFGVVIEDRKPNNNKYKILRRLATKKAVKDLEKEVSNGEIIK